LPGFRAIWRCEPTLLQDRESGAATPRKSGRLIASASRRSPSGTSCHTPGCRRPFSAGRGNRCLRSAGSAATNATPGRPKSIIQDSPGAHCRQCLRGTGWRRPGRRYPPAWYPSIILAAATAQGRVTRSVIPSVEPPCFHHPQGVPRKTCASPWLTKPHGQLTRCPSRQPSAVRIRIGLGLSSRECLLKG
jgi:hypothetical protein